MNLFRIALLATVLFASLTVQAQQSEYLHQPYISTRVMGMGGAYTAVADDYLSLYYNPAGLARLQSGQFVGDIYAGFTPTILGLYNDIKSAGSDAVAMQNTLAKYFGSHFASRVGLGGTWVRPGWGIGIQPADVTTEIDIHGTAGVTAGLESYSDTVVQFGLGWSFGEDKALSVGVAPKAVYRGYVNKDLTVFDLIANNQFFRPQDAQEGLTFDTDVGVLYKVKVPEDGWFKWLQYAKPTFGFAVRNAVDYGFTQDLHLYSPNSSQNVQHLERRFDVGSMWELPEFWVFKPRVMLDARDLGTRYANWKKCSHIGGELLWKAFGWLNGAYRAGLSEGYITAGISAELGIFNLDVATYSEEIGTVDSPRESRRYMIQMSVDI